jgi:hypothetical protein
MFTKKLLICAFLFFICYLIIVYLDKNIAEEFRGGRGGRGYGYGRGYYGGRGGIGIGRGYGYGGRRHYYGGVSYPVPVVDNYYSSYWYPYFLYPSYWY